MATAFRVVSSQSPAAAAQRRPVARRGTTLPTTRLLSISTDIPLADDSSKILVDDIKAAMGVVFSTLPIRTLPGCTADHVQLSITTENDNLIMQFKDAATEHVIFRHTVTVANMRHAIDEVDRAMIEGRRLMQRPDRPSSNERAAFSAKMAKSLRGFGRLLQPVEFSSEVYEHLFELLANRLGTVRHGNLDFV
jgi:hypothetical protein